VSGDSPSTRAVLRVVLTVVLSGLALYLVYVLRKPITWIVIAGFIAIAVSPPVRAVEARIHRRGAAVGLVYLGLVLVPVAIGAVLVPPIVTEAQNLADKVPDYAQDLRNFAHDNKQLRKLEEDYNITEKLQEQAEKLPAKIGGAAGVLGDIGLGIVNSLFAGITILILSIFMVGSGRDWVEAAIRSRPESHQEMLRRAVTDISRAVGGYCAGALGQALIAGVSSFIVLSILGVPYAAALSLIIFLLDLVPLVGATLGAIIVGLVTLFNDFPTDTVIWVVWSIVYQQIENTVIQPRIQSASVNVQPIVVLIAVLFGSTLFGVLGALLAIPFAAAIIISLREWRSYRQAVRFEIPPGTTTPPLTPPEPAPG
jgi:predicted PurR-regulated permease PerM